MLTLAETGEALPKDWELVTFEPHLEDTIQPHHLYLNLTTADPVTGEPTRVIVPADLSMDIELFGHGRRGSPNTLSDPAQEPSEDPQDALQEKGKSSALQKEKKEKLEKEQEKKETQEKALVPGAKLHGDAILRRAKPSPEGAGAGYFPAFRRDMKLSQDDHTVVLCRDKTTTASFIRSGARNRHTASRISDIDALLRRRQEEQRAAAEKSVAEPEGEGGALDSTDDVGRLPSPRTANSASPDGSGRKAVSPMRESLGRTVELLKRLDGPDPSEADVLDATLFSLPPSAMPERRTTKKGPAKGGPVRWIDPHLGKTAPTQRLHGNWPAEIRRRLARNYYDYEAPRKRATEKAAGKEKETEPADPAKKSKEKPEKPEKKPEAKKSIVGLPSEPFRLEVMVHSGKGRIVVGHKQPPKWRDRLALAGATL